MYTFNNKAYEALVSDLINDAFYLDGASLRGTIAKIRQLTEVVVRRILHIPQNDGITLGNHKIQSQIKTKNNSMLTKAVNNINKLGSAYTHTQKINIVTQQEVESAIENLFECYAYLLIEYFGVLS